MVSYDMRKIIYQKVKVIGHIMKKTTNHSCQVDHMSRFHFLKQLSCLSQIPKRQNQENPLSAFTYTKSALFDPIKIHRSSGLGFSLTTVSIAFPTKPVPPVTKTTFDMLIFRNFLTKTCTRSYFYINVSCLFRFRWFLHIYTPAIVSIHSILWR